jgi:hypothetical protein
LYDLFILDVAIQATRNSSNESQNVGVVFKGDPKVLLSSTKDPPSSALYSGYLYVT